MSDHRRIFTLLFWVPKVFSSHTMFIIASSKEFTLIHLVTFSISRSRILMKFYFVYRLNVYEWTNSKIQGCYMSHLCPHTFMPRHVCAQTRLCQDTFVPTHICAQTRLSPHTFVSRQICALTWYKKITKYSSRNTVGDCWTVVK